MKRHVGREVGKGAVALVILVAAAGVLAFAALRDDPAKGDAQKVAGGSEIEVRGSGPIGVGPLAVPGDGPHAVQGGAATAFSVIPGLDGALAALYVDDYSRLLVHVSPDQRRVTLSIREREASAATFTEWVLTESTAYDVVAVDGRGFGEFYVAGIARDDDVVIERWTVPAVNGARTTGWTALAPGAVPAPVGGPIGSMPSASVPAGGAYLDPAQRSLPTSVIREEVYRGDEIAGVSAIEVDPWGRFVLVADFPGDVVWQVDLDDPPTVTPIITAADALKLTESTHFELRRPELWDDGQKLWIFRGAASDGQLVVHLTDVGFDGTWDYSEVLTVGQWNDAGFPADYAEDYRNYGSVGFPHAE